MKYNTLRSPLIIPEYGRNIQNMIEHLFTIEDKNKRTDHAYFIVNVMAQMHPQVKESADYLHKLWDHLHIISNFKLDIDGPFPKPEKEIITKKPSKIIYNSSNIRYGHYGRHIVNIIKKASDYEDGPEKDAFIHSIANQMKKLYLSWNRDSVNDITIAENLSELSGGLLTIPEQSKLISTNEILAKNGTGIQSNAQKKKKFVPRRDNQNFQRKKSR
jgi:hypothetical protein